MFRIMQDKSRMEIYFNLMLPLIQ